MKKLLTILLGFMATGTGVQQGAHPAHIKAVNAHRQTAAFSDSNTWSHFSATPCSISALKSRRSNNEAAAMGL